MRKFMMFLAGLGLSATAATAHDLWLQPAAFWTSAPGRATQTAILIGHGAARENWGIRGDRIILLRNIDPRGRGTDLLPLVRQRSGAPAIALPLPGAGTHVIAMQSNYAESVLPADRFNEFIEEEGLTPAIRQRASAGTGNRSGREIFSRRAKTLVQVGAFNPRASGFVSKRVGFDLEIVPEIHPYAPGRAARIPVRVYFEGKPLPGALVKLTNLDADAKPVETHRTNAAGRAAFSVPKKGKWLLNVVWTKPVRGNPKADFDTTFSSLTFGYPN